MTAAGKIAAETRADPVAAFTLRAEARAFLVETGLMDFHTAVDELQEAADRDGLVDLIGQDEIQNILASAFAVRRP
jgi:hypothetical protein